MSKIGSSASSFLEINNLLVNADIQQSNVSSRKLTGNIEVITKKIEHEATEKDSFSSFLFNIHDHFIQKDTGVRSALLRTVRYAIKTPEVCEIFLSHVCQNTFQ
jgi:hypothetical protein